MLVTCLAHEVLWADSHVARPLPSSAGFSITILVAVASRFSGAHLNPAVTWRLCLAQRTGVLRLLYIPFQVPLTMSAVLGCPLLRQRRRTSPQPRTRKRENDVALNPEGKKWERGQ